MLKKVIKRNWHGNEDFFTMEFQLYVVGDDAYIAESHFCHVGISITQFPR